MEKVQGKVFPGRSEETYDLPFGRIVFIEATDFKEEDAPGYYGLAPGKSVMLRYVLPSLNRLFEASVQLCLSNHLQCRQEG